MKKPSVVRVLAQLQDIPNVGPSVAADLRQLGINVPADLPARDPYKMYDELCRVTGKRHDLCLLDTFIAAVRFMEGEPKQPWWKYTAERKRELGLRDSAKRIRRKRQRGVRWDGPIDTSRYTSALCTLRKTLKIIQPAMIEIVS